jgi:hypothetical protein
MSINKFADMLEDEKTKLISGLRIDDLDLPEADAL